MRNVLVQNMNKIKRVVPAIESKIKVKVGFGKDGVLIKGNELNEYLVEQIIRAVDFGFMVDDALLLINDDFVLEFVVVKEHTRRKNLRDVRARLIGTGEISISSDNFLVKNFSRTDVRHEIFYTANLSAINRNCFWGLLL